MPRLVACAAALGLDLEQFNRKTLGHVHLPKIADDFASGVRSDVNGTPTFYVNDIRNDGGWDYESLMSALQKAAFKFGVTESF
ncbi:MAG TPA: DsbA family protein [Acetobacteraceae bacterium]|nr:DsbA family protein [Acetobacteraceae bacterium]